MVSFKTAARHQRIHGILGRVPSYRYDSEKSTFTDLRVGGLSIEIADRDGAEKSSIGFYILRFFIMLLPYLKPVIRHRVREHGSCALERSG